MRGVRGLLSGIAAVFFLSACSGGSGASPSLLDPVQSATPVATSGASAAPASTATASVDLVLRATVPQAIDKHPEHVSFGTTSVDVTATGAGGTTTATLPITFGNPATNTCGFAGPYTCRVNFNAPVGNSVMFTATLRNSSALILDRGSATTAVTATGPNSVTIRLNPAIYTASGTVYDTTFQGVSGTAVLGISAVDAAGYSIIGTDTFLNPVTVTLGSPSTSAVASVPAGCPSAVPYSNASPLVFMTVAFAPAFFCTGATAAGPQTITYTPSSVVQPVVPATFTITPQTPYNVAILGTQTSINIDNAATGTNVNANVLCPSGCATTFLGVAWDTTNKQLFLPESASATVYVYDVSTPSAPVLRTAITGVSAGGSYPYGIVWDSSRSNVYITRSDGAVMSANAVPGATASTLYTSSGVQTIALDPTNTCLVTASGSTLSSYDLVNAVTRNTAAVDGSRQISVSNVTLAGGGYVATAGSNVLTLTPISSTCVLGTPVTITPSPYSSAGVAIDQNGRFLVVANASNKSVAQYAIAGTGSGITPYGGAAVPLTTTPATLFWDRTFRRIYVRDTIGNVRWYSPDLRITGPLFSHGNASTLGVAAGG